MQRFWRIWMWGVAAGITGFGIALTIPPLGADRLFRLMMFGSAYPEGFGPALDYIHFVHGVLGATIAGWGILMAGLLTGRIPEGGSWRALAVSLVVWFAADTSLSLGTGFWQNAVLNGVIAAALVPGLVATRPRRTLSP